jgi:hypothetical protein
MKRVVAGMPKMKRALTSMLKMNTANKLGPRTQTDRGTCPGVGL